MGETVLTRRRIVCRSCESVMADTLNGGGDTAARAGANPLSRKVAKILDNQLENDQVNTILSHSLFDIQWKLHFLVGENVTSLPVITCPVNLNELILNSK